MISEPKTEYRKEQHYTAIKKNVRQNEIPAVPCIKDNSRKIADNYNKPGR